MVLFLLLLSNPEILLGSTDTTQVHKAHNDFGEVHEHDLSDLLEGSGIVAYEACE